MLGFVFPPTIPWFVLAECLRWCAGLLRLPTGSIGGFRCGAASGIGLHPSPLARRGLMERADEGIGPCGDYPPSQRQTPIDDSIPLTGRQAELVNCQTTRSDARRTSCSRGIAALHLRACSRIPLVLEVRNPGSGVLLPTFPTREKQARGPGRAAPGLSNRNRSPLRRDGAKIHQQERKQPLWQWNIVKK